MTLLLQMNAVLCPCLPRPTQSKISRTNQRKRHIKDSDCMSLCPSTSTRHDCSVSIAFHAGWNMCAEYKNVLHTPLAGVGNISGLTCRATLHIMLRNPICDGFESCIFAGYDAKNSRLSRNLTQRAEAMWMIPRLLHSCYFFCSLCIY